MQDPFQSPVSVKLFTLKPSSVFAWYIFKENDYNHNGKNTSISMSRKNFKCDGIMIMTYIVVCTLCHTPLIIWHKNKKKFQSSRKETNVFVYEC